MPKILVCAATRTETQAVRRGICQSGVEGRFAFLTTGMGPLHAEHSLERCLATIEPRERPERIISTGIAGSWSPELRASQWIEAQLVCDESENKLDVSSLGSFARPVILCSVEAIHADPPLSLIGRISAVSGSGGLPVAVDMESFAFAKVSEKYRIPFSVFRYISDSVDAPLPDFIRHYSRFAAPRVTDRQMDRARALGEGIRSLLRNPLSLKKLIRDSGRWRADLTQGWANFTKSESL